MILNLEINDTKAASLLTAYKNVKQGQWEDWKKANPTANEYLFIKEMIKLDALNVWNQYKVVLNAQNITYETSL